MAKENAQPNLRPDLQALVTRIALAKNLPPYLIQCQVWAESAGNPQAVSNCGAKGLMQIMPGTYIEAGGAPGKIFDPEQNILAGCEYLRRLFNSLDGLGIPTEEERYKCALAAYNGGRGYIKKALDLAAKAGRVLTWRAVSEYLSHRECMVGQKRPDVKQITNYVEKIWGWYAAGTALTPR